MGGKSGTNNSSSSCPIPHPPPLTSTFEFEVLTGLTNSATPSTIVPTHISHNAKIPDLNQNAFS